MKSLRPYFLLIALIMCGSNLHAQQHVLKGFLLDRETHFPIHKGTITNYHSKKKVLTNEKGFFLIEVNPNDLIYLTAPDYHYDTIRYSVFYKDTLQLFLSPSGTLLPNVTVQSEYNKYQLDSMERRKTFEEMRGHTLPTVAAPNSGSFGIGINLDRLFKSKYKNQKKQEQLFQNTEERAYIDYRFSPRIVAYYTGLKGEKLRDFMYRYTPSYEWLRQHPSNEDILLYINDRFKEFKASGK